LILKFRLILIHIHGIRKKGIPLQNNMGIP
jgi:hypothetical protein